jgi:hypothetical protein
MFRRPLWLTAALALAAGVPYVALDDRVADFAKTQYSRIAKSAPATYTSDSNPLAENPLAVVGPASFVSLEEALRFDVTPEWVTARWPQAGTVTANTEHLGLRVPLVTGTLATDVAGSLTYYFDQRHMLQRITLLGATGDDSRLVAFACQQFGLRPTQTLDRGLYYGGDLDQPTSCLQVRHAPASATPAAKFEVALELNRSDVPAVRSWAGAGGKILPEAYRRW